MRIVYKYFFNKFHLPDYGLLGIADIGRSDLSYLLSRISCPCTNTFHFQDRRTSYHYILSCWSSCNRKHQYLKNNPGCIQYSNHSMEPAHYSLYHQVLQFVNICHQLLRILFRKLYSTLRPSLKNICLL